LLKTPRKSDVKAIDGGYYCHMGIENGILWQLSSCKETVLEIVLDINIDGLSISNSSAKDFWPILCMIKNLEIKLPPFVAGIYCGEVKPSDPNAFLQYFTEELKYLMQNGFHHNGQHVSVRLRAILCDAPAKALILGIKYHNGYYSCSKCTQQGIFLKRRICFPNVNFNLRTDRDFNSSSQRKHHKHDTILKSLGIGLVSQVPLDYLHLVCIGVMKKLLEFWLAGNERSNFKFNNVMRDTIDKELLKANARRPCDFNRNIRSLKNVKYFKATEFRMFLAYTGPVVLKNVLPKKLYYHFMLLSNAIRLLMHPENYKVHNTTAKKMLKQFVLQFKALYGNEYINHNVHNLLHLADDAMVYGNLDNFSCFPYESFMSTIQAWLRSGYRPLEQIYNRLSELQAGKLGQSAPENNNLTLGKESKLNSDKFYSIKLKESTLTNDHRNSWFLTNDDKIVKFSYVLQSSKLIYGKEVLTVNDFFTYPINSSNKILNLKCFVLKKEQCLYSFLCYI
jgi:hypothetical protein